MARLSQVPLSRAMVAMITEGTLSRFSFGALTFALPLYAVHLGLTLVETGLLLSVSATVAVIFKPVMGHLSDRFGSKKTMIVALIFRSLTSLLLAFSFLSWQLFAIRTLHGLSISLRDPAAYSLIAENSDRKLIASSFAWYQTAKSAAGPVGAALAGFVLAFSSNFSLVFGLSFLFSILPIVAVARFVIDPRMQRVSSIERVKPMRKPRSLGLSVFAFTGFALLVETTAMMTQNLFPLIATTSAGLNNAETGLIYVISTLAVVLAGPQFGWVSDRVSRRLVLLFRSFANGFSSVLYALVPTFPGFAVGRVLDGMGKAAYLPAWGTMMTHVSDSDRKSRATMMGLMSMGEDAGDIIAPILATFLWSIWGIVVMLAVRVALSIAAEVYTMVLSRTVYHGKRVQEKSSQVGEPEIPAAINRLHPNGCTLSPNRGIRSQRA